MLDIVLYQPEIAANLGAAIRVAACFGAGLDVIEPCGFPLRHKDVRRVGLDYGALAPPDTHASWQHYLSAPRSAPHRGRLILLTTRAEDSLHDAALGPDDRFLIGQESAGVPHEVRAAADPSLRIPLAPGARSLNMAVAGALALAEARRQVGYEA